MIHKPIIAPAEDIQADLPLHGAELPFWVYPFTAVLFFASIAFWVSA